MTGTDTTSETHRPLKRFRVLDLTNARAGPAAVRQLADWGAEVIRVEQVLSMQINEGLISRRLGGDFQNLHRNKRSIGLNLKTPEGLAIFKKLVAQADVVIENMRPAVKHRLGVDYESLKAINPRIVYGSISGFGQDGPYGDRGGVDQILQGMGGLMSVTGEPGGEPMRVGLPISDLASGMFLANGILVALLDREATGKGTWVRTSLLQSMVSMLDSRAMQYVGEREVPQPAGNNHPFWVPMGTFATKDGKRINIFASSQRMFPRFCKAAGLENLLSDPRCADTELRVVNADFIRTTIAVRIREETAADWVERLNAVGVPCGPVLNVKEVFEDPQVKHLRLTRKVAHPALGEIELLASPIDIEGASKELHSAAPDVGEHSREILQTIGYRDDQISELLAKGVIEITAEMAE